MMKDFNRFQNDLKVLQTFVKETRGKLQLSAAESWKTLLDSYLNGHEAMNIKVDKGLLKVDSSVWLEEDNSLYVILFLTYNEKVTNDLSVLMDLVSKFNKMHKVKLKVIGLK